MPGLVRSGSKAGRHFEGQCSSGCFDVVTSGRQEVATWSSGLSARRASRSVLALTSGPGRPLAVASVLRVDQLAVPSDLRVDQFGAQERRDVRIQGLRVLGNGGRAPPAGAVVVE